MSTPDAESWQLTTSPPPLGDRLVHVWQFSLDRTAAELHQCQAALSNDERDRAARFLRPELRDRFTAGRGLLRILLGRYLSVAPESLEFVYNSYGKPALAGPASTAGIEFNLSHSGALGLLGLSRERQLGVDVEVLRDNVRCESLAERFFSPAEVADLVSLPGADRRLAFFRCWTRKEAYIKALGRGLSVPLDRFRVSLLPAEPAALLWVQDEPAETERWQLRALEPRPGHVAAVAVERRADEFWLAAWPDVVPLV